MVLEVVQQSREGRLQLAMVEAIGLEEALSWIKNHVWSDVVVEIDCLTFVNDLKCFKHMVSPYDYITSDCKTLIDELVSVTLCFVKRSTNCVAHALAQTSSFDVDHVFSWDSLPFGLTFIILDNII
ncbi:hypothetical protein CsatB_013223 [Cannabis sativa]